MVSAGFGSDFGRGISGMLMERAMGSGEKFGRGGGGGRVSLGGWAVAVWDKTVSSTSPGP